MKNISQEAFLSIPILIPPLPEQRKIAAILSTWDEAIALTEQLIAALKQRKQALMQLLLTGQVRFPEFEGETWERVFLPDVVYFQEGPGLRNWQYRDQGMPFLNIRCIQDNSLDLSNVQYISWEEAHEKYSHFS